MKMAYLKEGHGSSKNALKAENNGILPMTKAVTLVSSACKISKAKAKELLELVYTGEWHHTSKYGNVTKFYPAAMLVHMVEDAKIIGADITQYISETSCGYTTAGHTFYNLFAAEEAFQAGDRFKAIILTIKDENAAITTNKEDTKNEIN